MAMKRSTMKVVFSLALLLLPLASAVYFDFMYLVQQWPKSYCRSTHKCIVKTPPPSYFTIHGLWPSYNKLMGGELWPEDCNSSDPLNSTKIWDMMKPLNKEWPSLLRGQTNLQFWSHEWSRHGTCSNLSQYRYFAAALRLANAKHSNLTKILADSDVVPSDVTTYTFHDIRDALARGPGFRKTYFQCSPDKITGEMLLYQVFQCVDCSGKKFVNCKAPFKKKFNCAKVDKIKLPDGFHH